MTKIFLNHKTEDKTIVLSVKHYLAQCLIASWLDSEDIPAGSNLNSEIIDNIAMSRYFMAFISRRYLASNWCMHELEEAQRHARDGNMVIIPVLLDSQDDLELDSLKPSRKNIIESILSRYTYIRYDRYDEDASNKRIADAIGKHDKIQFYPVVQQIIQGREIQLIQFKITTPDGILPDDFLRQWSLDIDNNFLDSLDKDREKPLRSGKAVAFSGKGPNWLIVYLTVPFKNQCPVYIFNNNSNTYTCVHPQKTAPQQLGEVLHG